MAQSMGSRKTPLTVFGRNPHQNHYYDGKMEELSETCNFGERGYQCWRVAQTKTNHGGSPITTKIQTTNWRLHQGHWTRKKGPICTTQNLVGFELSEDNDCWDTLMWSLLGPLRSKIRLIALLNHRHRG